MTRSLLGKVHWDRLSVKYTVHGIEISFDVPVIPSTFSGGWLISLEKQASKLHFPQIEHKGKHILVLPCLREDKNKMD